MYLSLLFVLAFFLRLINLNQSLWLDETIVAKVVRTIPFHFIPLQLSPTDVHPPLYYLTVSLWSSIFGYSEIALRLPSIVFSLIAGLYVYKIGVALKNKQVGLWSAAFFLLNPLVVYYSQEARMHMMATAFLSIALYYFIILIKEFKISNLTFKNVFFFNLFSFLAMCTFYGSGFFIAGMIVVYCVISTKRSAWRDLSTEPALSLSNVLEMTKKLFAISLGLLVSLLLLSPLLYLQLLNAKAGLADLKNWNMALGKVEIKNVAMIFLKFATGRVSWYPKASYYLFAGIPTVFIWLFTLLGAKKNKLFGYLFILPLLIGLFVSLWAPMMMYFRFLYLIPIMSILLTSSVIPAEAGIQGMDSRLPSFAQGYGLAKRGNDKGSGNDKVKYLLIMIYLIFSLLYLLNPQFHREDWKSLSQALSSKTPVFMIIPSSDPISYYRKDVSVFELRNINKTMFLPETIDIIPYTSEIYGLNYARLLQRIGCIKETQSSFRGDLMIEKWKCLRNA